MLKVHLVLFILFIVFDLIGQIRIVEVTPSTNTIIIKNFGSSTIDISGYRLCALIKYTSNLTTGITINSGSLNLTANSEVELVVPGGASGSWQNLTSDSDLGLYISAPFSSSTNMVDFVQWGSGGHGRESVAVTKGIWTTGEFVSGIEPFSYIGDGDQNGASFWTGMVANQDPTDITITNSSIQENQVAGTEIGIFSTVDPDMGDMHSYSLVTGAGDTNNASFQILDDTLISNATFNFEVKSTFSIRVETDDGNGGKFSKSFSIDVLDENDNPSDISLNSTSISENEPSVSVVGILNTSDEDADNHTYLLTSGPGDTDNNSFQILDDTLKSNSIFNFEVKSAYSIRIETNDGNGGTFSKSFSITVLDVNDVPTDINLNSSSISENKPAGTSVGALSTEDDDADSHTYLLVAGIGDIDNNSFQINGDQLESAQVFDRETKSSYSIRVETDDGNGGQLSKSFIITITEENDDPTNIILSDSTLIENLPLGEIIGTFSTIDSDTADSHTFNFVSGTGSDDNQLFKINGDQLESDTIFNFEIKNRFSIRVATIDNKGGTFSKSFEIIVLDENDIPSDINLSNFSIIENQPVSSLIGILSSTDEDTVDTHTYSFVSGPGDEGNDVFNIFEDQLLSNQVFNFELKKSYSVLIQSTDGQGGSFLKVFTIQIEDDNDPPTDILLDILEFEFDTPSGTIVSEISAIDEDSLDNHIHELVSGTGADDNDLFAINNANLTTVQEFSTETDSLFIRIRSTDLSGLFIEKSFQIAISGITPVEFENNGAHYPYPNPFHHTLTIPLTGFDQVQVNLSLYNSSGKEVFNKKIKSQNNMLVLEDLEIRYETGIFLYKIYTNSGEILSQGKLFKK